MANAFDARIVQARIEFPDDVLTFEGLSIYASGRKYLATLQNTCDCTILNLTKEHRNYILSRTSPLNVPRQLIRMSLIVGRESYGTFTLFNGYIALSSATQPPDIGITLTALTNGFEVGNILSDNQSPLTQLSAIAAQIASNNNLTLDFQATDKQIENYSYNGASAYQIQDLNDMGDVIAFVDNDVLTVVNAGSGNNNGIRLINAANGMVGIPQFSQKGVIIKMMIDNTVQLGNTIRLESEMLPAANGDYVIQGIHYEVASRDQQFFYTLDCLSVNYALLAGTQ